MRRWWLAAALATCSLAAPPARAQLALTAGVSLGGTNNATAEADVAGQVNTQEADAFTRLELGGAYTIPGARLTQDLSYTFATYLFVQGGQSFSFDNDLTYSGHYEASPDTSLGYNLGASQGRTTDFDLLSQQGTTGSRFLPTGSETYVSGHAGQDFHLGLGPDWSIGQTLNGDAYTPIDDDSAQPWTVGFDLGLNLDRIWDQDTGTLYVRGGHGRMGDQLVTLDTGTPPPGAPEPEPVFATIPKRQVNYVEGGLAWSHSYNEDWSTTIGGGVTGVQVPKTADNPNPPDPFADVTVHGRLHYLTPTGGEFTLSLERGVHANVYVGDVYLQNSIGLHGDHPFGYKEAWRVGGSLDYQRSQSVFVVDTKDDGLQVFSVAGTATWDWSKHRRLAFEVEYSYQDSKGGVTQLVPGSAMTASGMPVPAAGMRIQPFTLHRVMLLATVEWVYPQPERLRRERGRGGRGGSNSGGGGVDGDVGGGDGGGGDGSSGGGGDTDAGGDTGGSERAEPVGTSAKVRARSTDRSGEREGERASEGPQRGDGARP